MVKLSEMKNIEEYYEYYKIAIQKSPSWLEDVPDHLQTDELCKIAVTKDGRTLEYVYNKLHHFAFPMRNQHHLPHSNPPTKWAF